MSTATASHEYVLKEFLPKTFPITTIRRLTGGEVNRAWLVMTKKGDFVLRKLNTVFDQRSVADMDRVTKELTIRGWEQPRLRPTHDGSLYYEDMTGAPGLWTLGTFVPADLEHPQSYAQPYEQYGALLGKLHADLDAIAYRPRYRLPHYRDTAYHLRTLEGHRLDMQGEVARMLTDRVLTEYTQLRPLPVSHRQLIHGDPRTANMLFRDRQPFTFIDWDTLMWGSVWMDIGDLIRSLIEDAAAHYTLCSRNDIAAFCAGYFEENAISRSPRIFMRRALLAAQCITLELAARYLNDIVEDCYWEWDARRYGSRAESNTDRARQTLHVYERIKTLIMEEVYGY